MADRIVCPSVYVKEQLLRFGAEEEKVVVVPYGYTPRERRLSTYSKGPQSPFRLVFVGTVEYRKGIFDVIEVARALGARVELNIFGEARDKTLADVDIPVNVTIHGRTPFPVIEQAYLESDAFILPSHLEGSATVVYEALSYGLPCIVTAETGSVVRDGVEGIVVKRGNIESILNAVRKVIDDPILHKKMSDAAVIRSADFSEAAYGERICRVFDLI
ncbi:glycosyltransferase family 4 protein [Congregibacter variabilis]|uniref:Glycosyltransferase family 4 protein n=1 Tax=Congregibacter variabilis TaxID=3081200 RepID=A0ABZ0I5E9_9GAMM|nr:glycosyltransferase family 4 protein [Congregibacter sp. IMCC43200]